MFKWFKKPKYAYVETWRSRHYDQSYKPEWLPVGVFELKWSPNAHTNYIELPYNEIIFMDTYDSAKYRIRVI